MMRQIEDRIKAFILKYKLINQGDEITVGVSGGADSMALLHFLKSHRDFYKITLKVAHINHGIRDEAIADAEYVEHMCCEWKIDFYRHDCNIKSLSKQCGLSEEEIGRQERYNFFISLTNPSGKIATAHNMNDQTETMIMRFLRGSDIKGLIGIPPKRNQIIRPILCLTRQEVEKYCEHYNIVYRNDHTNFLPVYTRNKIRLNCIPYIEEHINPGIVPLLASHSEIYSEENDFLEMYGKNAFHECVRMENEKVIINQLNLQKQHPYIQKKVILLAISELSGGSKDITLKHLQSIEELMSLQSGKQISLPYKLVAIKQYDEILIRKVENQSLGLEINLVPGENFIKKYNFKLILTYCDGKTFEQTQENMYTKYIDYDKIKDNLLFRTRKEQDFIRLDFGSKKLKKFFIDEKIPREDRDTLPLIADGEEIVWVIGSRLNTNYYVTEKTKRILEIKLIKQEMLQEGLC